MSAATHKALALQALHQMLGDDLIRARNAFRGMTPVQMSMDHGQSGRSRAAILNDYEQHDARVKAAIAWLESVE